MNAICFSVGGGGALITFYYIVKHDQDAKLADDSHFVDDPYLASGEYTRILTRSANVIFVIL